MTKEKETQANTPSPQALFTIRRLKKLLLVLLVAAVILAIILFVLIYTKRQQTCNGLTKEVFVLDQNGEREKAAQTYRAGVQLCSSQAFKPDTIKNSPQRYQMLYDVTYVLVQDKETKRLAQSLAGSTLRSHDELIGEQSGPYLNTYREAVLKQIRDGKWGE